jgi:Fibronectin type III domain.
MKPFLLSTLFIILSLNVHAEEKTYAIEIEKLTLNSVSMSWNRTDGFSDNENNQPYLGYYVEYGIKGFERGTGIYVSTSGPSFVVYYDLNPDTEYSFFIRRKTVNENSHIWFEEYNFKTPACKTEILNTKEEMKYANGQIIKDLVDVQITFDDVAEFYELEYGVKGFEKDSGTIIISTLDKNSGTITENSVNRFSIGNENLQSNEEYDYYVRAKCDGVYGEWSEKKSFVTTDVFHYFGSEAFEVSFNNITNKSAIIEWRKIVGSAYSKSYLIEYGPKGFERGKGQTRSTIMNIAELFDLEPDTEYSFFIRSNDKSLTDPVWLVEHTFKTFPCDTEILGIKSMEMWTTCVCHNGAVGVEIMWDDMADSYELEYGLKDFQKGTGELIQGGNGVFISYENLNSDTNYNFYIRAKCNGEYGEWTGVNTFSTTKLHTGIKNVQNYNFKVFPNPVENVLYINLNSVFDLDNVVVSVFDMAGSIRYKSKYRENYDVSSLPVGTYIVNVRDEKKSETMIIQKK